MRLLFILMLLINELLSSETLSDKLSFFQEHDRVVYDFQQSISLVAVEHVDNECIDLLIATGTKDLLVRENISSWLTWYDVGCPEAISRDTVRICLHPTVSISSSDPQKISWLLTLLTLPLESITPSARKKQGPPPAPGEIDLRKPWQPPVIVNGRKLSTPSTAFSTTWPSDNSQLANRTILIYIPSTDQAVQPLPYWIESPSSSYHIKVIDSSR